VVKNKNHWSRTFLFENDKPTLGRTNGLTCSKQRATGRLVILKKCGESKL